jgi:hypothetical protein
MMRLALLAAIFFVLLLLARFYYTWKAESDYEDAVQLTDQADSRWRWEDLERQRQIIPDEQNGATAVLAASKFFNPDWPKRRASLPDEAVDDLPLFERLQAARGSKPDEQLIADIRAEVKALAPAWQAAQPLLERMTGRFPVIWTQEWLETPLPHLDACSNLVRFAQLVLLIQLIDGDVTGAWRTCRIALNAARAIGDEPNARSQYFRAQSAIVAMSQFEGVLAQSQPPEADLAAALRVLLDEMAVPLIAIGVRGDRAGAERFFNAVRAGTLDSPKLAASLGFSAPVRWLYLNNRIRHSQAFSLRLYNEALAIARSPEHTQLPKWKAFDERIQQLRRQHEVNQAFAVPVAPEMGRMAPILLQHAALARTLAVAVAMELYRVRNGGRWPSRIEQLAPDYLPTVPRDPFRDAPILVKPTADGWIIYSVGMDGEDNEGSRANLDVGKAGTDIGVRLYHAPFRRPPRQPLPAGKHRGKHLTTHRDCRRNENHKKTVELKINFFRIPPSFIPSSIHPGVVGQESLIQREVAE